MPFMNDVLDAFEIEKSENGKSCKNCKHKRRAAGFFYCDQIFRLTGGYEILNIEDDCCVFWEKRKENEDTST